MRVQLCSTCCYFETAVTKFAHQLVGVVVRDIVISAKCEQGRIQKDVGNAFPPPANFKHVFDEYNFFIISNLFDYYKPLPKECIIENV